MNDALNYYEEKDIIEDDLTVESIQNNKTDSILIDDFVEEDR